MAKENTRILVDATPTVGSDDGAIGVGAREVDADACTMIVESTIGTVGTAGPDVGVRAVTLGDVDDVEVDGVEDESAARLRALSSWFRR
jgi:hypothetical protein